MEWLKSISSGALLIGLQISQAIRQRSWLEEQSNINQGNRNEKNNSNDPE
jgi:hypothetical protein